MAKRNYEQVYPGLRLYGTKKAALSFVTKRKKKGLPANMYEAIHKNWGVTY